MQIYVMSPKTFSVKHSFVIPSFLHSHVYDILVQKPMGHLTQLHRQKFSAALFILFYLKYAKQRLQTQPELYEGSLLVCARETYIEGGSAAFLRGSVPRLMHKVPANSLFFCFYEAFKTMLRC